MSVWLVYTEDMKNATTPETETMTDAKFHTSIRTGRYHGYNGPVRTFDVCMNDSGLMVAKCDTYAEARKAQADHHDRLGKIAAKRGWTIEAYLDWVAV